MTFNLLMRNLDYGPLVASIRRERADIVAVQELTEYAARAIGKELSADYPHQALRPKSKFLGSGLFSRFPIRHEEGFRLSDLGPICQHAIVELPTRPIDCYNIHISAPSINLIAARYDTTRRMREVMNLIELLSSHKHGLAVVGDFNMTPRSAEYRRLRSKLGDAFREVGRGAGATFPNVPRAGRHLFPRWPAPFPLIRIDYIFHSLDIRALRAHRGRGEGSDHCPVISSLTL